MCNYMNFASKPEIGLHILSYLKPENLEKQKTYSGTLWEGPQLQNQKNVGKPKNQKKQIFWNSLGGTPHPEEYPNMFFFFFNEVFWFCTFPIQLSNCT